MPAAVHFRDLAFAYPGSSPLFERYSATVEKGTVCAILGPNGCGKTTLLRVLLGLLKGHTGELNVHGRTAFVPQLFQINFAYTALEMVLMGRAPQIGIFAQPSRQDRQRALEIMRMFGIETLASQSFQNLSGGQRQLILFARAVVSEAEVLFLDEPTSALDLRNQDLALRWIATLTRDLGKTVLLTTHDPGHAHAVAGQVLLMNNHHGGVFGLARHVLTEANLLALYGIPIRLLTLPPAEQLRTALVPIFLDSPAHGAPARGAE